MARLAKDGMVPTNGPTFDLTSNTSAAVVRGIGVDEVTALLLDPKGGNATTTTSSSSGGGGDGSGGAILTAVGNGTAYACELSSDALRGMTCVEGESLQVSGVLCERLTALDADTFDLSTWRGSGVRYTFDVANGEIIGNPYGP